MRKKLLFSFFLLAINANILGQSAVLYCRQSFSFGPNYFINGIQQDYPMCVASAKKIQVAVLDSCSFIPWNIDSCLRYFNQGNYYSCVTGPGPCGWSVTKNFEFGCMDSVQMNGLVTLLNAVPQGYHILVYSFFNYIVSPNCQWPVSVRNAFSQLGSNILNTVSDTLPFIVYIKKGYPSTLHEVIGTFAHDTTSMTVTIECVPASVQENKDENLSVTLFPNPATNELRIQNAKLKIESVQIYDVMGQSIQKLTSGGQQQITIDVSPLKNGIYLLQIKTKNGILSKKFIKQ